jgi:hypothetical protein
MANVRGVVAQGFLGRATPVVAGGVAVTTIRTGDGAHRTRLAEAVAELPVTGSATKRKAQASWSDVWDLPEEGTR